MTTAKQFKIYRSPFYKDRCIGGIMQMVPDPGTAWKTVSAVNKDDLLQQMQAFGDELGRACEVSQKHLGRGPGFMKLPWQIKCCEENTPTREDGSRLQREYLERERTAR
jgi:hypothetical protein